MISVGRWKGGFLKPAELHCCHLCPLCPAAARRDWQKSGGEQSPKSGESNLLQILDWRNFIYSLNFYICRWNHTSWTTSYATSAREEGVWKDTIVIVNIDFIIKIDINMMKIIDININMNNIWINENAIQVRRQVCSFLLRQRHLSPGLRPILFYFASKCHLSPDYHSQLSIYLIKKMSLACRLAHNLFFVNFKSFTTFQ